MRLTNLQLRHIGFCVPEPDSPEVRCSFTTWQLAQALHAGQDLQDCRCVCMVWTDTSWTVYQAVDQEGANVQHFADVVMVTHPSGA